MDTNLNIWSCIHHLHRQSLFVVYCYNSIDWRLLVQKVPHLLQVWNMSKGLRLSLRSQKKKGKKKERGKEVTRNRKVDSGKEWESWGNKAAQEICGVTFLFPSSTVNCNTPSLTERSYGILTNPKPTKWSWINIYTRGWDRKERKSSIRTEVNI